MVVEVVVLPLAESIDDNDTIDDDNDMVAGVIVVDVPMIISFGCLPFVVLFTESWFCPEPNELFWLCIAVISLLLLDCGSINRDDFIVWLADSIGDNVINIIIIILFFRLRTDWASLYFYSTFFVSLAVYVDYSALIAMITSINFNIEISFRFCCIFTHVQLCFYSLFASGSVLIVRFGLNCHWYTACASFVHLFISVLQPLPFVHNVHNVFGVRFTRAAFFFPYSHFQIYIS